MRRQRQGPRCHIVPVTRERECMLNTDDFTIIVPPIGAPFTANVGTARRLGKGVANLCITPSVVGHSLRGLLDEAFGGNSKSVVKFSDHGEGQRAGAIEHLVYAIEAPNSRF